MRTRYLTFTDLTGSDEEEAALTYPFPPDPSIELLELTRKKVLEYQQWRLPELQSTDRRYAAAQLQVVAVRLTEISSLLPAAENADIEKSIEIAANLRFTTQPKSLEGFHRLEDHRLEYLPREADQLLQRSSDWLSVDESSPSVAVPPQLSDGADAPGDSEIASEKPPRLVRIFYATDREFIGSKTKVEFSGFRSQLDTLTLGTCEVSIPPNHVTAMLESPSWWKLEFRPNPRKHVVLRKTNVFPEQEFYSLLRTVVGTSDANDAFVFVHGFNVSFRDAARRTAQLANDLQFRGAPIMFSWPSKARVRDYTTDEATMDWVMPHLKKFLTEIVSRGEVRTLHLIAHSMGNRALARALKDLAISKSGMQFNEVVMAAPDIDRGEFIQLAHEMKKVSQRVTLYASSSDRALALSQKLHSFPRAGEAGENIVVTSAVETVDASEVDTDFLSHSYSLSDRRVIGDMHYILQNHPPNDRYDLEPQASPAGQYWAFRR